MCLCVRVCVCLFNNGHGVAFTEPFGHHLDLLQLLLLGLRRHSFCDTEPLKFHPGAASDAADVFMVPESLCSSGSECTLC